MKTKRIKIYSFNELSESAKRTAIENYQNKSLDFSFIYDDARNTVEKFNDIFNTQGTNNSFLECRTHHIDDNILELSGARLQKYLWNNFKNNLFKGKYFSLWSKKDISFKYYKEGYPVLKTRYSKILKENSCVLTGMCYDDDMLKPIYDFLELRTFDSTTFEDLLKDCFYSLEKTLKKEKGYMYSDEYISEQLEGNEFLENGKLFNY